MSSSITHDLRVAFRSLWHAPAYSLTAVITLAVGMSGSTLVFSAINAVLLKPIPVAAPERIVAVSTVGEMAFLQQEPLSYAAYDEVTRLPSLSAVVAHRRRPQTIGEGVESRVALGESVSANYFTTLGLSLPLGRPFAAGDRDDDVVVISHLAWRQRFNGDAGVIGTRLNMSGRSRTVIGVAPEGFTGLFRGIAPEFWIPIEPQAIRQERSDPEWWVHGRLRDDASIEQAGDQLAALAQALAERSPEHADRSFRMQRLSDASIHPAVPTALLNAGAFGILGVALLLLLVASLNVANLVLARATLQQRDAAIRTAIGATRWRVVRGHVVEGLLIALAAAIAGVLVAQWAGQALRVVRLPAGIGFDFNLTTDWRVLAFGASLVLLTTVMFAVGPALRTTSLPAAAVLAQCGRSGSATGSRWRSSFLAAQAAVAMLLIVLGGLALRSLMATGRVDPGFDVEGAIAATSGPGLVRYDAPRAQIYLAETAARVRALPGVDDAGWMHPLPLSLNIRVTRFRLPEQDAVRDGDLPFVDTAVAWPNAFRALGISVVEGREFDERDREGQPLTALINRAFAERFFAGRPAIGRRFGAGFPTPATVEVIGVVENFKNRTLGDVDRPMVFTSGLQDPLGWQAATLVVRPSPTGGASAAAIVSALRAVDAAVPVFDVQPLSARVGGVMLLPRYAAGLFGSIALVSLLLIAVGLSGTVAFWTYSRTRELGIRLALGSERRAIIWLVVRQTLLPVMIGGAAGIALSWVAANAVAIVLTGVSPQDPLTLMVASVLLGGTALAAAAWPALRASRLDPVEALRTD
ncbi:MAG TPA: ADOP family duplicated permease [Vicinamibacterales bacterium]|nr:ADOP family duplicated permease [Vicinamibacterales bacterium]